MEEDRNVIIELDHLSVAYDGKVILDDISLGVGEGDFIAITGPNGGGKTTMLRAILRLLPPTRGRVIYRRDGMEVKTLPIGYLPQKNMIDSRFPISVEEVVASGLLSSGGMPKDERKARVADTVELVGLTGYSRAPIGSLSGGQLQRALLGRAVISRPSVLVLDEPLSYVDKRFEHHMYDIVADLSRHTTILLVSHEMTAIAGMATRHIIIDRSLHECHSRHHFMTSCGE